MRKKSHLSLARYLVYSLDNEELNRHRFSFYFGSILPDLKPSFFYKRHEIEETFSIVKNRIRKMNEWDRMGKKKDFRYFLNLGQISHYLADYFTFPHNKFYQGGLRGHCSYEEKLKKDLRRYLKRQKRRIGKQRRKNPADFGSVGALCGYIIHAHKDYAKGKHNVVDDIRHIVEVNQKALHGILHLLNRKTIRK